MCGHGCQVYACIQKHSSNGGQTEDPMAGKPLLRGIVLSRRFPACLRVRGLKVAPLTTGMLVLLSHTIRRACHSCVHCRRWASGCLLRCPLPVCTLQRLTRSVWLMLVTVLRFTWSALGCDLAVIVQSISACVVHFFSHLLVLSPTLK